MYVCVCVHAYVLTHARTHAQNTYVRMYVCMYVLMAFADKLQMLQGSKLAQKNYGRAETFITKIVMFCCVDTAVCTTDVQ